MDELVFCCPRCFGLSYVGVSMDRHTLEKCQHRPVRMTCQHCQQFFYVSLTNMMVCSGLDEKGRFTSIRETGYVDDPMTSRAAGWLAGELRPPRWTTVATPIW